MKCTKCYKRNGTLIGTYVVYGSNQQNKNYELRLCFQCIGVLMRVLLDSANVIDSNRIIICYGREKA